MKWKVVKILINVLNFKNKEGFNKLMEQISPIISFCKQFGYINPDKLCTWLTIALKQIVPRLGTSFRIHHINLYNVLELVGLLVKANC